VVVSDGITHGQVDSFTVRRTAAVTRDRVDCKTWLRRLRVMKTY